jgi:hypothetical protein
VIVLHQDGADADVMCQPASVAGKRWSNKRSARHLPTTEKRIKVSILVRINAEVHNRGMNRSRCMLTLQPMWMLIRARGIS